MCEEWYACVCVCKCVCVCWNDKVFGMESSCLHAVSLKQRHLRVLTTEIAQHSLSPYKRAASIGSGLERRERRREKTRRMTPSTSRWSHSLFLFLSLSLSLSAHPRPLSFPPLFSKGPTCALCSAARTVKGDKLVAQDVDEALELFLLRLASHGEIAKGGVQGRRE